VLNQHNFFFLSLGGKKEDGGIAKVLAKTKARE
jgi:hypothetical protein